MFLEVKIGTTMEYPNLTAFSANGYDLGGSQGCLGALFLSKPYPSAEDYISGLRVEGWILMQVDNTVSRSAVVMHEGWLMGNYSEICSIKFIGKGRYKTRWDKVNGRWQWYFLDE